MWPQDEDWEEDDSVAERQTSSNSSSSSCTGSSRSHYAVEPESCPWTQKAEMVTTSWGEVKVTICGELSRPALLTYHDIGLNHSTCFQGLLLCEETASLLLQNFCIFHIDAPGHEAEAEEANLEDPYMTAEEYADQVAEVAYHFRLTNITCIGVSAGAYIMTLLAIRRPQLVKGLMLVSPICRAPTWSEWGNMKVLMASLSFYGMARNVKDYLLERYFCQDQHGYHGPGTDALLAFRRELDERDPEGVMRYMNAMHNRKDLTKHLAELKARVLVVIGAQSPFLEEAEHMIMNLNHRTTKFLEVAACGSLVTEERPQAMQQAMRAFFKHVVPALSPARGYRPPPDAWFYTSKASPSVMSSCSSSPNSEPVSPMANFFTESRRGYVSRSPVAVTMEELSLARVQGKLRPIRIRGPMHACDSDEESEMGSEASVPTADSPCKVPTFEVLPGDACCIHQY